MPSSDVIDYQIIGDDLQAVVITLDPGEACVAEAGAMMFMEEGIAMATQMSMKDQGGMFGKIFEAGKRLIAGESFFITMFGNNASVRRCVAFASAYPGHIVPLELSEHGGSILCQKEAFLCAARGTDVDIAFSKRLGAGFFGGEGFILQRINGDGLAFLHAGGSVLRRELEPGEKVRVDTGCIVAFDPTVEYDIQFVGGVKTALFGGEGLFFATLEGPGTIWLQTLPFSRLADRIIACAPRQGGKRVGEGSVLGGVWNLMDGKGGV
ncbi:MAG: TIGR00266 family protein [Planctomycetes bacterium]|nr:TIGR00266 family protein [Planctomycetota bacterium]NOG54068.1 TIGR00266 family protein [Planctomycetota bacterium]